MEKRRNDIALIAALFVLAIASWIVLSAVKTGGEYAVVTVDGEEICRMTLDTDETIEVGENGTYNTITVQDGQVFVSGASCPDKLCMAQGHKSHGGETIVCLPNKLVVSVVGGNGGQTDAVAG